jgi:hypothetical protein
MARERGRVLAGAQKTARAVAGGSCTNLSRGQAPAQSYSDFFFLPL